MMDQDSVPDQRYVLIHEQPLPLPFTKCNSIYSHR